MNDVPAALQGNARLRMLLAAVRSRVPAAACASLAYAAVAAVSFGLSFGLASSDARSRIAEAAPVPCASYSGVPAEAGAHAGMVRIPGGHFAMGSNDHYAEESLTHEVKLDGFWIDRHDVTNAQFARFVAATGYVTLAERAPDLVRHPDLLERMRVPGSVVFVMPEGGHAGRWRYVAGADWRHPQGPGSGIEGRENHPVVQVAYEDALAYAHWLDRELPTEAQWEYAARGGLAKQIYVWGNDFAPRGKPMANTWQGPFPLANTGDDGFLGTSPVGCFAANGFGLYDMAGNVWQWTSSWYRPGHEGRAEVDPAGPDEAQSYDPRQPGVPAKVIKGGSYLCAPNYCMRYRPAARQAREIVSGTSHIGFRTVTRL